LIFFYLLRPPPSSSLFPYTTLFRSVGTSSSLSDTASFRGALIRSSDETKIRKWPEKRRNCAVRLSPRPDRSPRRSGRNWGESNRSEEHTSELQSRGHLVCRLLLEKK